MSKVITIDGPASSGKNSVGHILASKLGYQFIDTGSIYRVFALFVLKSELLIRPTTDKDWERLLGSINMEFKNGDQVFANGVDATEKLHLPEVTGLVPKIAAIKKVREIAKAIQRKVGLSQNTVMAGRDIGSEIFPGVKYKFFLTADLKVRAKRRWLQLKVYDPKITLKEVIRQTKKRDDMDIKRKVSPMRVPKDAITVDNTKTTPEETVEKILSYLT